MKFKATVYGLGKIGMPLAAVLATKGNLVIGVDSNKRVVEALNRGKTFVQEPRLQELIASANCRLSAMTDGIEAARQTDVSFLIVPTPSERNGNFSLNHILDAVKQVGQGIKNKDSRHLVVITSTVMPGGTEGEIIPFLEATSGKKCGPDFGVCYSPEFVALGSVVRDLLAPDLILIGESDREAGDLLEELYKNIKENSPAIERMNIINAEVAKLAVNTFVTTKISFANMLSEICEQLPGGNAHRVADAIGNDSRIGKMYIKPGVAYGGPCFPRDNKALSYLIKSIGAEATLALATDKINRHQNDRMKSLVLGLLWEGAKVAILGLSYKPGTSIVEGSAGLALAQSMADCGSEVRVFDPEALDNAKKLLSDDFYFATSLTECVDGADIIVITTPWPEFKELPDHEMLNSDKAVALIDGWNMFTSCEFSASVNYTVLGKGVG